MTNGGDNAGVGVGSLDALIAEGLQLQVGCFRPLPALEDRASAWRRLLGDRCGLLTPRHTQLRRSLINFLAIPRRAPASISNASFTRACRMC